MTEAMRDAVRAYCNEDIPAGYGPCTYPDCICQKAQIATALAPYVAAHEAAAVAAAVLAEREATKRIIRRRLEWNKQQARVQASVDVWRGVIVQAQDFLNALQSDCPPGDIAAIRARTPPQDRAG